MTDNPRYALYQSKYEGVIANKADAAKTEKVTIAASAVNPGPAWQGRIASRSGGRDILAILATGAYNYSMSSNYNRIPRPAVVLVKDGKARLLLKGKTITI